MSGTPGSDTRSGIGVRLKAGRERMGLTLLQVAEKLHVDPKVLESLEAERFDDLGAPVYAKGHLKRYSELTGENTQELLDLYTAATKVVLPDLTQLPKATHHADPRKLVLPSLVVLIAFVLIGTVWWVLQNFEAGPPVAPVAVETEPEAGSVGAEPIEVAPAVTTPTVSTPAVSPAPATTPPSARIAQPAPESGARRPVLTSGTRAGTTAGTASSARITKTTRLPAAAAGDAGGRSVNVTLKFATDSWVEVYDANGQRLFYDIGSANSSRALSGTPPLRVVLGNASAVSLNINGRAARVPASAMRDDGAQFTINRSGRIVRAQPDAAASPASRPNGE